MEGGGEESVTEKRGVSRGQNQGLIRYQSIIGS